MRNSHATVSGCAGKTDSRTAIQGHCNDYIQSIPCEWWLAETGEKYNSLINNKLFNNKFIITTHNKHKENGSLRFAKKMQLVNADIMPLLVCL
jgi:hypothetical protein